MAKILNKVKNCETIKWSELKTYEFNTLKDNNNRDVTKLKNSIINSGFTSPFYVWSDHRYVIDGTGRHLALLELEKEGVDIPDLPFVAIEATNKKEALKLVLQVSSQHGQITQASLSDFTSVDFEIEELKELQIEELNIWALDSLTNQLSDDYSLLDEVDDKEIEGMADGVKKAIQIEFTPEDYQRAYELCQHARSKKVYIGEHLIGLLQNIKDGYENA
jgi:hypothetical protein